MAEHQTAGPAESSSADQFNQNLEAALGSNEPMCLAMIRIASRATDGPDDDARWGTAITAETGAGPSDADLADVVQSRLGEQLRGYDLLARMDETTFVVVVKTLADARVLDSRMFQLYKRMAEPYSIDGTNIEVPVALGAAIRLPMEPVVDLLSRADKALTAAEAAGGKAPVVI